MGNESKVLLLYIEIEWADLTGFSPWFLRNVSTISKHSSQSSTRLIFADCYLVPIHSSGNANEKKIDIQITCDLPAFETWTNLFTLIVQTVDSFRSVLTIIHFRIVELRNTRELIIDEVNNTEFQFGEFIQMMKAHFNALQTNSNSNT